MGLRFGVEDAKESRATAARSETWRIRAPQRSWPGPAGLVARAPRPRWASSVRPRMPPIPARWVWARQMHCLPTPPTPAPPPVHLPPPGGRAAQRAGAGIGGLGRAGKGLVIVQAQVIAEPHEGGHGGHPTRRKRRFGETAGGEVVFSTKFERPHHGRVKVHRRPLVIHLDRRFSILGDGPRRRHFAIIRGILLCRAPCALARGFCCFGQPKRGGPRRNNKRDVLEGGERQWQTQRTLQTWQS